MDGPGVAEPFGTELGEVAMIPGTGGIFQVTAGDTLVWDRKRDGGFPDIVTLKKLGADAVVPDVISGTRTARGATERWSRSLAGAGSRVRPVRESTPCGRRGIRRTWSRYHL